jgi:hypothetical protein
MKCEICGNEYKETFCDNCGWEELNILDDDYLKIFNKRKEIYKKKINDDGKFVNFLEKLINKQNEYLKTNIYLAKIFVNDILDILKEIDKNYYIEFLLAKFYLLLRDDTLNRSEITETYKEANNLLYSMSEEQKNNFYKIEKFAKSRGAI